ncbi:MAG: ATP-binding protein, partial [Acidimicrobiales bacterium]
LSDLRDYPGLTVVDLEASPEHMSRGTAGAADVLLLVAEPYFRSLEATRRLGVLAGELAIPEVFVVANKVRSPDDAAAIAAFCDQHQLSFLGEVPWSDAVRHADGQAAPLIDIDPTGPVVAAIGELAGQLHNRLGLAAGAR